MHAGETTHREIFSKSYQIKPKSDCIYHAPIDLEQQTNTVCLLFQINRKMVNSQPICREVQAFRNVFFQSPRKAKFRPVKMLSRLIQSSPFLRLFFSGFLTRIAKQAQIDVEKTCFSVERCSKSTRTAITIF